MNENRSKIGKKLKIAFLLSIHQLIFPSFRKRKKRGKIEHRKRIEFQRNYIGSVKKV